MHTGVPQPLGDLVDEPLVMVRHDGTGSSRNLEGKDHNGDERPGIFVVRNIHLTRGVSLTPRRWDDGTEDTPPSGFPTVPDAALHCAP